MAEKKTEQHTWYIAPLDPETNRVIGQEMADRNMSESRTYLGKSYGLTETIPVWIVPFDLVRKTIEGKKGSGYKFRILRRTGKGKPVDVTKIFKTKTKKKK